MAELSVAIARAPRWALPRPGRGALAVLARNFRVWRKLTIPSLLGNFADPLLYILGLGYGLGRLVGEVRKLPPTMYPLMQEFWSQPKCFHAMADHLLALERSVAAIARVRTPEAIPVVVISTSKAEEDVLRSYDLGVSSFISKPVTYDSLLALVRTLSHYWFHTVRLPDQPSAK